MSRGMSSGRRADPCEKFLYGFKAARRAARAADTARTPELPLTLPAPAAPGAGRLARKQEVGPLDLQQVSSVQATVSLLPPPDCPRPVRTRQGRLWPQGNRTR
jgi:hypothetical protein